MNSGPFAKACQSGKLDIIQLLWNLFSPDHQKVIIKKHFVSSFIAASKNGYLEILKQLMAWAESEQCTISLLTGEAYSSFIYAADQGYLEIIQFIWESLPPSLRLEALKASNFAAYRLATRNHHLLVVNFIEEKIDSENKERMKKALNQGVIPRN